MVDAAPRTETWVLRGKALRQQRTQSRLPRGRLAYLMGLYYDTPLCRQTVLRHEQGKTQPTKEVVVAYARLFGCRLSFLRRKV